MDYPNLEAFLNDRNRRSAPGPVAVLFMEDHAETNSTIRHHMQAGFASVLVMGPASLQLSPELTERITWIGWGPVEGEPVHRAVTRLCETLAGRWIYWGYNAEYLFFPFCETRSVGEFTDFMAEERRASVHCMVVDLYAPDLRAQPDGVSLKEAHFDGAGYYAVARWRDGERLERQVDLFGGLRWRFEEHVPFERRRIDRTALFRAESGLALLPDHLLNEAEFNTYACPWHHNATATICSFRAAKSLKSNPGSSRVIHDFVWPRSERFAWHSRQLLEHGMMEPGQWF
jgi:hypothetical protein